jgi:hypothetical protein
MRAYGSVTSFSGRSDMLKAASVPHFLLYPGPSLKKQFNDLMYAAKQFSTRRNEIAHGIVQPYFQGGADGGYALIPSYFATKKRLVQQGETEADPLTFKIVYAYNSEGLLHWMTQFQNLSSEALRAYYALAEARAAGKAT